MSSTLVQNGSTATCVESPAEFIPLETYRPPQATTETKHPDDVVSNRDASEANASATAESAQDETSYPTGFTFWAIIMCQVLVIIFVNMDVSIVATAVPAITDHFHTVADVGWYSAAYRLCGCSFQFIFGKLYTIFPVRRIFLISVAIFVCGSLLSTFAPASAAFAVARAISGVGYAGVMQGCFTTLVYVVPLHKRSVLTGVFNAAETVSSMAAPSIGGVIIANLSWRWCFGINIPIGVLTFLVIGFTLKVDRQIPSRTWPQILTELDVLGNVLFIPALTCLFLALSWAGTKYSWKSPTVIGLLFAFVAMFGLYVWHEKRRGDEATLPPRVLRNRSIIAGAVYLFFSNSASTFLEYYMPTYFQVVRGWSPLRSGVLMLPALFGYMTAVLAAGFAISLFGYYVPFMYVSSILMPTFSGLMTTWSTTTSLDKLVIYSLFMGFATGLGFGGPQTAAQTVLPTADVPLGIAVILFAQSFGPAVTMAVGQTIFNNALYSNLKQLDPALTHTQVVNLGLSELVGLVPPAMRAQALGNINASLMHTWYLSVAASCMTLIGSLLVEWRSVKEKRN